jgi:hypothetical protein
MTAPSKSKKPIADTDNTKLPAVRGGDIRIASTVFPGEDGMSDDDLVKYYAGRISQGWQKAAESILNLCKDCAEADERIPAHRKESFYEMAGISQNTFYKLAAIGRSPALYNPDVLASLPPNQTILYAARKLSLTELKRAIAKKIIKPDSNRAEVQRWVSSPKNCRYAAATRPEVTRPEVTFTDWAYENPDFVSLMDAWNASPLLIEIWRRASESVRHRFILDIMRT